MGTGIGIGMDMGMGMALHWDWVSHVVVTLSLSLSRFVAFIGGGNEASCNVRQQREFGEFVCRC